MNTDMIQATLAEAMYEHDRAIKEAGRLGKGLPIEPHWPAVSLAKKDTYFYRARLVLEVLESLGWMEARAGFEPANGDFAGRCLNPLGYLATTTIGPDVSSLAHLATEQV